nr:MAG TPA: hypothetical protein [Caudoviricetes sp.]
MELIYYMNRVFYIIYMYTKLVMFLTVLILF